MKLKLPILLPLLLSFIVSCTNKQDETQNVGKADKSATHYIVENEDSTSVSNKIFPVSDVVDTDSTITDKLKNSCDESLFAVIEVWNRTGKDNLIQNYYEDIDDLYKKSEGWDSDNYPYPKKFDVKVKVTNNNTLYDNEENVKLGVWRLNVSMKLNKGMNADALYSLNAIEGNSIELLSKNISDKDFKKGSSTTEIWIKDIPFEKYYQDTRQEGRFINRIKFQISFSNKANTCKYEHIFFMKERAEP